MYNNFPGWHRDHRVTGRVVLDCVYPLARDHLAFPELAREYEPHSVREVHVIQGEQPRLVIDISETMELKLEAIRCHASQIRDFKDFEARMRNRAAVGLPPASGQMAFGRALETSAADGDVITALLFPPMRWVGAAAGAECVLAARGAGNAGMRRTGRRRLHRSAGSTPGCSAELLRPGSGGRAFSNVRASRSTSTPPSSSIPATPAVSVRVIS